MILPELLGAVLASISGQDLLATGMRVCELTKIVDAVVDHDPQVFVLVMRLDVVERVCLTHIELERQLTKKSLEGA